MSQTMELRSGGKAKTKDASHHQQLQQSSDDVSNNTELDFQSFVRSSLKTIIDGQNSLRDCISNLQKRQDELEAMVKDNEKSLGDSIEFQSSRTSQVEKTVKRLQKQNAKLLKQIDDHTKQAKKLRESSDNLERHSRRHNLLLCNYGPEKKDEKPEQIVNSVLKEKLGLDIKVEVAHRTGKLQNRDQNKHRPIIFKVLSLHEKDSILKSKRKLDGVACYIKADEIEADRKERFRLKPVADAAYKAGKKTVFRRGKLYIDNKLYKDPSVKESSDNSDSSSTGSDSD